MCARGGAALDPEADGGPAASSDAGTVSDAGGDTNDGPIVADADIPSRGCHEAFLRYSRTREDVLTAVNEFLSDMRDTGSSAYFDHAPTDIGSVYFQNVQVDRPVDVEADPRRAIMDWLAAIPDSPVRALEYVPNPERPADSPVGGFVAGFVRTRIGETPFGQGLLEAFRVSVQANGRQWRIVNITMDPVTSCDGAGRPNPKYVHIAGAPD